ncbi:hypothetical protein ACFLZH_02680 [Patescibacteria group bacterium]
MKKIYLIPLLFLITLMASGCISTSSSKGNTWQGTYYPDGCLTCESDYVFSPIFDNFEDCKSWALNKKSSSLDKVTCNKNCKNPDEYGIQTCEEVVRNWKIFDDSLTFDNYKE